jgi:hypothetical protein
MGREAESEQIAELELQLVGEEEDDPGRVEELTYQLRQELMELDVEKVELRSTREAPPGTRGGEAYAVGELIVQASIAVLPVVLATVQSWVSGLRSEKFRLKRGDREIELTGRMSAAERRALINAFLDDPPG